jgi:hypothetical protein
MTTAQKTNAGDPLRGSRGAEQTEALWMPTKVCRTRGFFKPGHAFSTTLLPENANDPHRTQTRM